MDLFYHFRSPERILNWNGGDKEEGTVDSSISLCVCGKCPFVEALF